MAHARELPPLARLIHALRAEKIRFQIVGMSGAILQGAPEFIIDADFPRRSATIADLMEKG